MKMHPDQLPIEPFESDFVSMLSYEGYFTAITKANLSKKKFLQSLLQIQEDERKKLGHELHDSVNASLCIARLYLSLLPATDERSVFAKEQLSYIISMTEQSIRSISCNLVISQQHEAGIIQLIDSLVERIAFLKIFNISIRYIHKAKLNKLVPCQKIVLYRVVQEQLNNIIKHSRASTVCISLVVKQGIITLKITDNGIGFNRKHKVSGIGLANIADRTKLFDGTTRIFSSPGKGCSLTATMPVLI